jgi:hypothetical protein
MTNRARTALAAAILSGAVWAAFPASAGFLSLLKGVCTATGSSVCLFAPGGFNKNLQPLAPQSSFAASPSSAGLWTCNGAGSHSLTNIDTCIFVAAAAPS